MSQAMKSPRQMSSAQSSSKPFKSYFATSADSAVLDMRYKNALRLKEDKNTQSRIKSEKKSVFLFPKMRVVIIVFILAILVVAQYTAIQNMGYRVSQAQAKLDEVVVVKEQLQQEYSRLGDLETIEKKASEKFGMVYPEKVIAYRPSMVETDKESGEGGEHK